MMVPSLIEPVPFPPSPFAGELSGGQIVFQQDGDGSRHGDRCTISARFRPAPGSSCVEFADRHGGYLSFSYYRAALNLSAFQNEIGRAAALLHRAPGYRAIGSAFASDADLALVLRPFAHFGQGLHAQLFGFGQDGIEDSFDSDDLPRGQHRDYGRCLREWLHSTPELTVTCKCRSNLPWNLLYEPGIGHSQTSVDRNGFWGVGKRVQLLAPGLCSQVSINRDYSVAAGYENEDSSVRDGSNVHVNQDHPFVSCSERIKLDQKLDAVLYNFGECDVLYVFCHGQGSGAGLEFARIAMNSQTLIASELEALLAAGRFRIRNGDRPLVIFLNGCKTDVGSTTDDTIPGTLVRLRKNRFCFVSTLSAVPAWAAAEFARRFLVSFLEKRESVGAAAMAARLSMLRDYRNPAGLFYAVHGKLGTRID